MTRHERRVVVEFLITVLIISIGLAVLIIVTATDERDTPLPELTEVAHVDQSG